MNLLYLLGILTFFNQGIGNLSSLPLYFFLKETLGISIPTIMMLGALTNLPWLIKPVWAMCSDLFPLKFPKITIRIYKKHV